LIPTMQTKFESQGNCFAAAAASILEVGIDDVPQTRGDGWLEEWRDWLKDRGLSIEWYAATGHRAPRGYSILTVKGVCEGGHAVVCLDGRIVHDPKDGNLERSPLSWLHWYVFTKLNPAE
jgi:hypothetical protein